MKQINPLTVHSAGLYRVSELQTQAARDKLALENRRSRLEPTRPVEGQSGWLNLGLVRLSKLVHFRVQALPGRLK
jgi:hypothetical protein